MEGRNFRYTRRCIHRRSMGVNLMLIGILYTIPVLADAIAQLVSSTRLIPQAGPAMLDWNIITGFGICIFIAGVVRYSIAKWSQSNESYSHLRQHPGMMQARG